MPLVTPAWFARRGTPRPPRVRGARRRDMGFTFVELTVAMLVLSAGLLGVASTMVGILRSQTRTISRTEMISVAESKFDELRAYAAVGSGDTLQITLGGSLSSSVTHHNDVIESPSGRRYVRRWLIEAGPAGTRTVRLRVEPEVLAGSLQRSLEFETMLMVGP